MGEDYSISSSAPFNMGIATLMSLRTTLDKIRDIEGRIDYPATERQRIKIGLVKRFYIDSSPLIENEEIIEKYEFILDLKPIEKIFIDNKTGKNNRRTVYCYALDKEMDKCLLKLQLELQKKRYFMPPREDLSMAGLKMS